MSSRKDSMFGWFMCGFTVSLSYQLFFCQPQPARALDIQMTNITVRDFFAGCALVGFISRCEIDMNDRDIWLAWQKADKMMKQREIKK